VTPNIRQASIPYVLRDLSNAVVLDVNEHNRRSAFHGLVKRKPVTGTFMAGVALLNPTKHNVGVYIVLCRDEVFLGIVLLRQGKKIDTASMQITIAITVPLHV
jgi:hypothetical protein